MQETQNWHIVSICVFPESVFPESLGFARFYKGFAQNDPQKFPARFARRVRNAECLRFESSGSGAQFRESQIGGPVVVIFTARGRIGNIFGTQKLIAYRAPHFAKILVQKG